MSDYNKAFEDGAVKMEWTIAEAILNWPGYTPPLDEIENTSKVLDDTKAHLARHIGQIIDEARIGGNGYIFTSIATDTPMKWKEVDEARYDEMLGCLPPATMTGFGFLVGEPWDHHPTKGYPRFTPLIQLGTDGKFYEGTRPIGIKDFRNLDIRAVAEQIKTGEG